MTRIGTLFVLIIYLASIAVTSVAAQTGPLVISPRQGDVLQGVVIIKGTTDLKGFVSAEVDFAYTGDPTVTWFLIATNNQRVNLDNLAVWDTTTITDGNYILRVRVYLKDGSFLDAAVPNLRVRNYTPIETPTPAPTALQPTVTMTPTLTSTPFPAPTPLPPNASILTPVDVSKSIAYGGLGAVFLLIVLGIYLGLRRR
jgi:hypothetical protein